MSALEKSSFAVNRAIFGGEASREEVERISTLGRENSADFVLALGGGAVLVYAFVVSGIIAWVVDRLMGFLIDEDHEVSGIDLVVHAETAYDLHATAGARSSGSLLSTPGTLRKDDA